MASEVLKADLKSPLVLDSTDPNKTELISNQRTPSTGISYFDWTRTSCDGGGVGIGVSLSGRSVVNSIVRNGKWQLALTRVHFRFVGGTAPAAGVNLGLIGLRIADQELGTYSNTLFTQTAEALSYIQGLPPCHKQAIYQRALLLNKATEQVHTGDITLNTDYCTYVPSLIPSFTRTRANFDLDILEPLRLRTTFASQANIGLGANTDIQSGSTDGSLCDVFTCVIDYDPEYRDRLTLSNFGNSGQNIPYFSYNFEQQVGALTGMTSTKVIYNSTTPCAINYMYIRPPRPTTTSIPLYVPTSNIDLTLNNKSYIQNIPSLVTSYKLDMTSGANILVGANASPALGFANVTAYSNKVQTFTWCDRPQDRNGFSGALAYGGVKNPEFTFYYAALGAPTSHEYVIVSLFYCELLMNGKSGSVSQSVSS